MRNTTNNNGNFRNSTILLTPRNAGNTSNAKNLLSHPTITAWRISEETVFQIQKKPMQSRSTYIRNSGDPKKILRHLTPTKIRSFTKTLRQIFRRSKSQKSKTLLTNWKQTKPQGRTERLLSFSNTWMQTTSKLSLAVWIFCGKPNKYPMISRMHLLRASIRKGTTKIQKITGPSLYWTQLTKFLRLS